MQRPKTRYADCDGLKIAYQVIGDGPIDLLFIQGWLTNIEYAWESPDYARFLTKLSRFARVIFFDKRGTGMSDRNVGAPTLEERSEDINAVLEAVGSSRAVLFGMSEGGAMATVFAATYPERVSHLVLCGSRVCYKWAPDFPTGATDEQIEEYISDLIENWGGSFELTTGAPSVANDPAAAEWFAAYLRFSASPSTAEQITRLNFEVDIRDILSTIHVPTLVLHREGDIWCPVENGRHLAENIADATLRILPGNDHIAWYGDQDGLVEEIKEFVTGEWAASNADRALLTVVFMDLVGSTEKLAEMGDERWRSILEQLDISVARRVQAYKGQQIKHTGDGYLLAFTGPTKALECAQAIRRDVERLGLQSRIGTHSGECERRGDDLSGLAVHIAARIMAKAEPQSIACSQTVKDLVIGSGHRFTSLGSFQLRGVPGEWNLFEVSD